MTLNKRHFRYYSFTLRLVKSNSTTENVDVMSISNAHLLFTIQTYMPSRVKGKQYENQ